MEIRSDGYQSRFDKIQPLSQPPSSTPTTTFPRTRLHTWFVRICWGILIWTFLVHFVTVRQLWNPKLFIGLSNHINKITHFSLHSVEAAPSPTLLLPAQPLLLPPLRIYNSNGYLKVSCNGGLNQMRAAICDMVTVARFLNLTLVVPELDKRSFWADPSNFGDIFDKDHFINSLRDEVRIIKRLPKKLGRKLEVQELEMPPVSWSNEKYYLQQILPLFSKYQVIHFNRTDTRLANNGIPIDLQRLRCRVNFQALKFTPRIEALGNKLVQLLQEKGSFVALHLRYEMDMLAFSGCSHGCSEEEANELKTMRYAYPWWREKELVSEERRSQGMCPLTPEEAALVLRALGFEKDTQIYIASGEIYGSERRLSALRDAFPRLVKKEMLLGSEDLQQFQNHSSQMAALDFTVSVASNIFVPTYDGNMAKLVEGHRRHLGYKKTIVPDRKKLVELIDFYQNKTLSWDEFVVAVRTTHEDRQGRPSYRKVIVDKPKEEDYFYANPHECLSENK